MSEIRDKCEFCLHSEEIVGTNDLLCRFNAVVTRGYICKKYSLDLLKYPIRKRQVWDSSKFSHQDFSIL